MKLGTVTYMLHLKVPPLNGEFPGHHAHAGSKIGKHLNPQLRICEVTHKCYEISIPNTNVMMMLTIPLWTGIASDSLSFLQSSKQTTRAASESSASRGRLRQRRYQAHYY